jgi:hypothetical protein
MNHIPPYLSAEQLSAVTPWSVDAIEKMVARGALVKGVHFFQPFGRRSQRIFKWSAIRALIEGGNGAAAAPPVIHEAPVLAAAQSFGRIDVEKATADLQRLLD